MSDKKHRAFPAEFKQQALELLKKGEKSAAELERDLGITPGLLGKWKTRYHMVAKDGQAAQIVPSGESGNLALAARAVQCGGRTRNPKKSAAHLFTKKTSEVRLHYSARERVFGRADVQSVGGTAEWILRLVKATTQLPGANQLDPADENPGRI